MGEGLDQTTCLEFVTLLRELSYRTALLQMEDLVNVEVFERFRSDILR